jgi:hypothetical protein
VFWNVFSFSICRDTWGLLFGRKEARAMVRRARVGAVETTGIEPATSGLQSRRSPN